MRKTAFLLLLVLSACSSDPEKISIGIDRSAIDAAAEELITRFVFVVEDGTTIYGYPDECIGPSQNCIIAGCGYSKSDQNFELQLKYIEKEADLKITACAMDENALTIAAGSVSSLPNIAPATAPDDIVLTLSSVCSDAALEACQ